MTRNEGRWLCKTNWYAWKAAGDWWILLTPQKNKGSCGKWTPLWVSVASLLHTGLSLLYYQTMKTQCLGVEQRGWREFNIPRELTLFFIRWWGEQLKQFLGTVLFQLSNGPRNVDGSAGCFPLVISLRRSIQGIYTGTFVLLNFFQKPTPFVVFGLALAHFRFCWLFSLDLGRVCTWACISLYLCIYKGIQ